MFRFVVGFYLFFPFYLLGQSIQAPKNEYQIEATFGHTFPSFTTEQNIWRGSFYSAASVAFGVGHSITPNFQINASAGMAGYALTNKSEFGKYVLDFSSPFVILGARYYKQHTKRRGYFYRLSGGAQLGYQGSVAENFTTFSVYSESTDQVYSFVRPEIGVKFIAKEKRQGHTNKYAFELSTFFRYNFNRLGTATFQTNNSTVIANPKGDVVGIAFRYIMPYGKKTLRQKTLKETAPVQKQQDSTLIPN